MTERRRKAAIPDQIGHREKWRLALDMIDEVIGWQLRPPLIVGDAGYGDAAEFRQGLHDRDLVYVVGVSSTHTAFTEDAQRTAPPCKGAGRRPPLIYRDRTEPTRYWLSDLPANTPYRTLVRLAKLRWR